MGVLVKGVLYWKGAFIGCFTVNKCCLNGPVPIGWLSVLSEDLKVFNTRNLVHSLVHNFLNLNLV